MAFLARLARQGRSCESRCGAEIGRTLDTAGSCRRLRSGRPLERSDRRLSAAGRSPGIGRRPGAHPIHEEVAAALSGGGGESGRSRRRAVCLSPLSSFPMEGAADDERPRAHQRRIPPTHEDAGQLAQLGLLLLLLFGLLRSGQVKLRALVGYHDLAQVTKAARVTLRRRMMTR